MKSFAILAAIVTSLQGPTGETETLKSPDRTCSMTMSGATLGGFKVLHLPDHRDVRDVNGTVWLDASTLVYSVSPIYGDTPGLFAYRCSENKIAELRTARNRNSGYPKGADYFEVTRADQRRTIYFYYAPDVDSIDFRTFRSAQNLYQIRIDGKGFSKVQKR